MLNVNSVPAFDTLTPTVPNGHLSGIPRWHFAMLNDRERNQAFFDAIQATDFAGKTVLDIGTGSGLLAMLIAQRGAHHVYTCESNPHVAAKAAEIIRVNGLESRITVINKLSTDLVSGVDIPKGIDLMISETVDCGFFGEGFGHALQHAQDELLSTHAAVIPSAVTLHACLLSSQDVANLNYIYDDVFGLDVSAFNAFKTPGYFPVRLQTWPHRLVSHPVAFYEAKFQGTYSFDQVAELSFSANANALAHGVVFWFDLYLKDDHCLSNAPVNIRSHWMQAVQLFDTPTYVREGHGYNLTLSMNRSGVAFGSLLTPNFLANIAS